MTSVLPTDFVALFIFITYFCVIIGLFYVILLSIQRSADFHSNFKRGWIFMGLAVASLVHTWYWMIRFMTWSYDHFMSTSDDLLHRPQIFRISAWLKSTALFEQAWQIVCSNPLSWWWSEQLCLFTAGAFTVFIFHHRQRVPYAWAYMLLGQLVAISVAWSLFNLALVITPFRSSERRKMVQVTLPASLTVPVAVSLLTISLSPFTSSNTFLPNLLAMHLLLILPLTLPSMGASFLSARITSFYTFVALVSMILRIHTTFKALSGLDIAALPLWSNEYPIDTRIMIIWNSPWMLYRKLWDIIYSHPAQASIAWDVIWTSITWFAWGFFGDQTRDGMQWTWIEVIKNTFSVMATSIGVTAPMEFGRMLRNSNLDVKED